ncbi:thermonuclease family protein [Patescibacteria group bacterium]|nr:thermonuclease family protein [Patescibacteria group bacterium]
MTSLLKTLAVLILGVLVSRLPWATHQHTAGQSKTPHRTKEATMPATIADGKGFEIAAVKRVIDGDTIELTDKRRVRYIGMNAPEIADPEKPAECFGPEARSANRSLVEGKKVRLVKDVSETDTYGRFLRFVYVGDTFVNDALVKNGFARIMPVAPDITLADEFNQAQIEAQASHAGLWGQCPDL